MNGFDMSNQISTRTLSLDSLSKKNLCRLYNKQLEVYRREAEKLDEYANALQIKILRGEKRYAEKVTGCCRP